MTTLYVGNLNFQLTNEQLHEMFSVFGEVTSAKIIIDRETGRSKGFAFVDFENAHDAREAVSKMDGAVVSGRNLKVNEARPR